MKIFSFIFSLGCLFTTLTNAQTLIWNEDFQGGPANWNITLQPGTNAADANLWVISDDEGGVAPPGCGVANNGDITLHVSCNPGSTPCSTLGVSGAAYFSGDQTLMLFDATTDIRAAYTNAISTMGQTNLEFRFDWIGVGQANTDYAELEYSIDGGATWVPVWTQTPGNVCAGGQGEWAEEIVALPAALENQADLRFAYRWRNNNDEVGSDPSFAVNNLRLFADASAGGPPNASFTASSTDICEGDCIDFTDNSTGTNISSWNWDFGGGAVPNTSTDQNPSNICFDNEGVYTITLTVTDDNGTNSTDISINVADCSGGPNASFTASNLNPCEGDCIDFTDNSTGTNISSWAWDFGGGAVPNTSTDQNPSNICFDNIGSYTVSLTITDDNGTSTIERTINVIDCSGGTPPNANFNYDGDLCQGNCLDFEDLSSGSPTSWQWNFDGANPSTSTAQNPTNICFDSPGQYNVSLTVSNAAGTSTFTFPININPAPGIAATGDTTIEVGGTANLSAEVFGPGDISWSPSNSLNCNDCPEVEAQPVLTTVYTVTVTDFNGCSGSAQVTVNVEVEDITDVPSAFSPNNDGVNDILRVLGDGIESMNFRVFNRYGQLVFETTDQNEGWDGTFNGNRLNQGVFAYTLEYTLVNGVSGEKEGSVTLIK
jgi:gliding motility-associated-like protein